MLDSLDIGSTARVEGCDVVEQSCRRRLGDDEAPDPACRSSRRVENNGPAGSRVAVNVMGNGVTASPVHGGEEA